MEPSLSFDYRGLTVHKAGPWPQGPVFLQRLALLRGFDLAGMGPHSAEFVHTVTEAAKLAFADREAWYGDPAHAEVPVGGLLDPAYTAARRELIGGEPSTELRPGSPGGRTPVLPPVHDESAGPAGPSWLGEELEEGIPAVVRSTAARGDTCCVTATDAHGNMVVATPGGG